MREKGTSIFIETKDQRKEQREKRGRNKRIVEGEGTRGAPKERAKLTRTIFYILRSEVSSIEKYDAPRRMVFFLSLGPTLDAIGTARLRGHHIRAASRIFIKRKEFG